MLINEWFPWLAPHELSALAAFRALVVKFNDSINLVSPNGIKAFDNAHLADCLIASKYFRENMSPEPTYDLGSGNGLPGIVLGVLCPEQKIILVDRDLKKIEFLKHVSGELKLTNVTCVSKNLGQDKGFVVGQAVSRAMAPLGRFVNSMGGHLSAGSKCYLMKTPKWESELAPDHGYLKRSWSWRVALEYSLPEDAQKRVILELIHKPT